MPDVAAVICAIRTAGAALADGAALWCSATRTGDSSIADNGTERMSSNGTRSELPPGSVASHPQRRTG